MGVIDLYFVDNEVEVRYQRKVVDCACTGRQPACPLFIECTTSAPDVRTFEAMGGYLLADHKLQSLSLLSVDFFLSGARPALPMGVAPEAIAEIFRVYAQK
jgi:hypothetical protein